MVSPIFGSFLFVCLYFWKCFPADQSEDVFLEKVIRAFFLSSSTTDNDSVDEDVLGHVITIGEVGSRCRSRTDNTGMLRDDKWIIF